MIPVVPLVASYGKGWEERNLKCRSTQSYGKKQSLFMNCISSNVMGIKISSTLSVVAKLEVIIVVIIIILHCNVDVYKTIAEATIIKLEARMNDL